MICPYECGHDYRGRDVMKEYLAQPEDRKVILYPGLCPKCDPPKDVKEDYGTQGSSPNPGA